ncbi:hypothetical protein CDD83_10293 [Cordyceps sp. RAO-2017]|nr:hypothetical protein CDD83_10293 [Cordyceps sp. RAO-2017]
MATDNAHPETGLLGLVPINEEVKATKEIAIIAIHGLDTKSPDTWEWRRKEPGGKGRIVNWLEHLDMLPKIAAVLGSRIFSYV